MYPLFEEVTTLIVDNRSEIHSDFKLKERHNESRSLIGSSQSIMIMRRAWSGGQETPGCWGTPHCVVWPGVGAPHPRLCLRVSSLSWWIYLHEPLGAGWERIPLPARSRFDFGNKRSGCGLMWMFRLNGLSLNGVFGDLQRERCVSTCFYGAFAL